MIVATVLSDLALLVTACTGLATVLLAALTRKAVHEVHADVKTENGVSLGQLAEHTEARRIAAHIDEADRTPDEQAYVDRLAVTDQLAADADQTASS